MTKLVINAANKKSKINKEIYGHFSEHLGRCIYEGIYVGEHSAIPNRNGMRTDVVEALKKIKVPVLRWPGGCFADEYHWRDGIGPKEQRKKMINTHWGGVVEDNSFGTHEFFELCEQLGCEAYVNGNLGSGTVQEMSEWVEYITFGGQSPMTEQRAANGHPDPWKLNFFGVGNENWGCGGNMNPDYYANEYRRYQTYVRNYDSASPIFKICCGANVDDYEWTEEVLKTCFHHSEERVHGFMDGLSLHYYVFPEGWDTKGSATEFDEKVWYKTLAKAWRMKELVERHGKIMDRFDPEKKIGMIVDEWGAWYDVEPGTNPGFLYQQNTIRDALVAGITLNIFNKHSDRVKMANLAQMVNVLQSVILTDGADMILTPTYHVFDMYKYHQDAQLLDSYIETEEIGLEDEWRVPNLTESVSQAQDGSLHITITNLSAEDAYDVETALTGYRAETVTGEIVHGEMHEKNTFEEPQRVQVRPFEGARLADGKICFTIPACSVLHLEVKGTAC
ncbi:Alpha-L-arabinofuranosidase domain protein [Marvinbryantia formatexigens DSM 14469]|uniref:non-reducing end alpha-L-arabinofuranosidase n=1 Tax=Marvinbryantia formatexigens DSM 14469 TaxID=478749 RepID=C6L9I9_9FIRM|nr:alpha-N-arabinofuranosidase [Marvinbryantia formatexigens]EET62928.1 Alpha-L-arabinofuranosidase domain protein [Marvinbryantia formatexigens DSM 14469]UWO23516.1 alpha-N-arabinofuranosidase [Marvinbryantia formatexigens DSM 14469]SDG55659.1 alpha-N-arabinofuranosidase [Marvinbryantia formatexigens]